MKNILLLIHGDHGEQARIQAALDLVRALDGHLTCIDVLTPPIEFGAPYGGSGSAVIFADEVERKEVSRQAVEARLAREMVPWNWVEATGDLADCLTRASGLADLIVLNCKLAGGSAPDMRDLVGRIALKAHKPIVAVPETAMGFNAAGNALVAWNGSDPIMATLRACVPLLALAGAVRLFTVYDGTLQTPAEEAASYLSRHGIHADIAGINDGIHPADALIASHAAAWRADYCVIGAYSRSRTIEALFGGVTRGLLGSSKIPLVIGH